MSVKVCSGNAPAESLAVDHHLAIEDDAVKSEAGELSKRADLAFL